MSKSTPGPWIAECVGVSSAGPDGIDVYEINNGHKRICEFAEGANARLIAAAPDLLEALRVAVDAMNNTVMFETELGICRAAIAKAEGK